MKIEFTVPFRRVLAPRTLLVEPTPEPQGRPPRIARLGHISPARLTQIMVLLHLAPPIQEYILFLPAADARLIPELDLRKIAREPRWDRQRALFERLLQPCH
jgi:hypothetical protein